MSCAVVYCLNVRFNIHIICLIWGRQSFVFSCPSHLLVIFLFLLEKNPLPLGSGKARLGYFIVTLPGPPYFSVSKALHGRPNCVTLCCGGNRK